MKKFKISVIIPTYNEEKNVGRVLEVVTRSSLIDEVIVVDNASTDKTGEEVKGFKGLKILVNSENKGIGYSYVRGAKAAGNPLLLFCDADLTGLEEKHLQQLIGPVAGGEVLMTVGVQERLHFMNRFEWYRKLGIDNKTRGEFTESLGGERCLWKKDFLKIKGLEKAGYGTVQTISNYFLENNLPFKSFALAGVGHEWKVDKWGGKGVLMELDCYWKIYTKDLKSKWIKLKKRLKLQS